MTGFLNVGFTLLLSAVFYGLAHWEAKELMASCRGIPESAISLATFLDNPQAMGEALPPLIDHAVKGQARGQAPEAVCFYAKWQHPNQPQLYSIWSKNREVFYRCP